MKTRIPYFAVMVLMLILFAFAVRTFSMQNQPPEKLFPATVSQDCAPWDGAAFTMSIPYDSVSAITISIWRSPDLKFPAYFSFPDTAGQAGHASLLSETGPLYPLNGELWLQSVIGGRPVAGRFSFTSEAGERFEGKFVAEWEGQRVLCG